jgi:hypothetical protein
VSISLVFSEQFSNATSIVWISRGEVGNSPLLYELLGVLEVSCNVLDQTSPLLLGQNLTVEDAGLGEVVLIRRIVALAVTSLQ